MSLLILLLKQFIVNSASPGLPLFKAAKNAGVWLCLKMIPISQRTMQEIEPPWSGLSNIYDETLNRHSKVNSSRERSYVTFTNF
ncbi:MAG: hypothetical protein R3311_03365 [Oceanisphaera sp.]|nr:hypothetical protein [Oceanisphaera sp.]